jgi:uncharacterized LabA/DUF88 family protein
MGAIFTRDNDDTFLPRPGPPERHRGCFREIGDESPAHEEERDNEQREAETLLRVANVPPRASDAGSPRTASVAVFWDFENVRNPKHETTASAVHAVRTLAREHGKKVEIRLYYDAQEEKKTDRWNFAANGVTLVDCPKRRDSQGEIVKDTLDKMLIVDAMEFSLTNESCCVVLIASDGDYSYMLNKLRNQGVKTVVIHGPHTALAGALLDAADIARSFHELFLSETSEEIGSTEPESEVSPNRSEDTPSVEKDVAHGRHHIYLNAVKEVSGEGAEWILDSKVGDSYYKKFGCIPPNADDKNRFRELRASAFELGFVQAGRKNVGSPRARATEEIVRVTTLAYESHMHELSQHYYIRLTGLGRGLLERTCSPAELRNWKTKLCIPHQGGKCTHGENDFNCSFAHGTYDLRAQRNVV